MSTIAVRPQHGDTWELDGLMSVGRFVVMHVCHHGGRPMVTGYWEGDGDPDLRSGAIPLDCFLARFRLVNREEG